MARITYRLHRGRELEDLMRRGRARDCPLFRVMTRTNVCGHARIVLVVAKKAAKRAVIRNRLRRRAREWLRRELPLDAISLDIAIFFKAESALASREKFYDALTKAAPIIYPPYPAHADSRIPAHAIA